MVHENSDQKMAEKEFIDHCLTKLLNMMERVEIVLYRMAKNAKRSSVRQVYTEALHESRQQRKRYLAEFRVQLARMIERRNQSGSTASGRAGVSSSAELLRSLLSSGEFNIEEISLDVIGSRLDEDDGDQPAPLPGDDHHVEFVRQLKKGTWFEFRRDNGAVVSRGRFTWRNSVTNVYFFIDQRGHKVAEKTFDELAEELRLGHAAVIHDPAVLDRIQSNLLSGLRRQAQG